MTGVAAVHARFSSCCCGGGSDMMCMPRIRQGPQTAVHAQLCLTITCAMCEQGHTAVQLQEVSAARLFKVSLGNLVAGARCFLSLEYVQLMDSLGSMLEFAHQATWVPPYQSSRVDLGKEVMPVLTSAVPAQTCIWLQWFAMVLARRPPSWAMVLSVICWLN